MPRKKQRISVRALSVAGGLALIALLGRSSRGDDATDSDLREQIRQLRQEVNELKAERAAARASTTTAPTMSVPARPQAVTAAAADRAVAEAVADAQVHSQLTDIGGFTAGYRNGGFWIQSGDGNFSLNPNVFAQFRYISDFRHGSKNGGADDDQSGFEFRRLKFSFDGNLWSKDFVYKAQFNTAGRSPGTPLADEVYVKYHFAGTPFSIKAGQFSNNWDHETESSSKRILAVERSLLQNVLASGGINSENYVQGVELSYDGGDFYTWINYNDGFNSRNTAFTDGGGGSPLLGLTSPDGAVSGRFAYKVTGDWKNYDGFTAMGVKKDLLVIGGGFDYEASDNVNVLLHTADIQYESATIRGLSLFASYYGAYRDFRSVAVGADDSTYEWGALLQIGYMLNEQWEIFGRYDFVHLDKHVPAGAGTLGSAARIAEIIHEMTVGANYYIHGHAAKFTIDATYLPNGCPIDLNAAGILSQPNGKSQFMLRAQFQLLL